MPSGSSTHRGLVAVDSSALPAETLVAAPADPPLSARTLSQEAQEVLHCSSMKDGLAVHSPITDHWRQLSCESSPFGNASATIACSRPTSGQTCGSSCSCSRSCKLFRAWAAAFCTSASLCASIAHRASSSMSHLRLVPPAAPASIARVAAVLRRMQSYASCTAAKSLIDPVRVEPRASSNLERWYSVSIEAPSWAGVEASPLEVSSAARKLASASATISVRLAVSSTVSLRVPRAAAASAVSLSFSRPFSSCMLAFRVIRSSAASRRTSASAAMEVLSKEERSSTI
mmetsp:Transcript_23514/g.75276  ORF Transcript_23514/g.75276 Transcript_23514/m.75276 type:complete len:287 (-) Transcript_23514:1399-2259(-)